MASKQTYECYVCKRNGFADTRVYLDGKSEDGKTIYKNEDMSAHQHKQQHKQVTTTSNDAATTTDLMLQVKLLHQKMDVILDLLGSLHKQ